MSSCLSDDEQREIYKYWGVVSEVQGESYDYKIILDDDVILIPETSEVSYSGNENDRVFVYFEIQPDFVLGADSLHVNVVNIYSYDIKDVITISGSIPDSLGTDPLAIYSNNVWQSNDLLNMIYYYDTDAGVDRTHIINLVYFPDSAATDSMGVYLEMRHKSGNAAATDVLKKFDFFDLTSIVPFADAVDSVPYTLVVNPGTFGDAVNKLEGYYYKPGLR